MLNKRIVLIGFKQSGKTKLGQLLAHSLKVPFVDTDRLIEGVHPPYSCCEIYDLIGPSSFRELESQVIASLKYDAPMIIATGGGSLIQTRNIDLLKKNGILIYLKTSLSLIQTRILQQEATPSFLKNQDLPALFKERTVLYEKAADKVLEMDHLNVEESLKHLINMTK